MKDIHPYQERSGDKFVAGRLTNTYSYFDADGDLVFQVLRFVNEEGRKEFRQRVPDETADGGWKYSTRHLTERPLYRLPEILKAVSEGRVIYIAEGEKDVDALWEAGFAATCNPMGADDGRGSKWHQNHTESLTGASRVVVIADNDEPGMVHADYVATQLSRNGSTVKVKRAPAPHKDAHDMLSDGVQIVDLDEIRTYDPDPFWTISLKVAELAESAMSPEAKASKAMAMLRRFVTEDEQKPSTGRLITWPDFIGETTTDDYDWIIEGMLERQERLMVVAAEGVGKALDLTTPIPTPDGWTTMGALSVGDRVFDRHGNPCAVTFVTPEQHERQCFQVVFSDGAVIVADAEHLWYTETLNEREKRRPGSARTTQEIRDTLISGRMTRALNHAIPATDPLDLPELDLPIPPYTLGAWLGDGSSEGGGICSEDPEILANIQLDGYEVRFRPSTPNMYGILGLQVQIRDQNLKLNKHIPSAYLRSSFKQRLALLQGLMDTDGTIDNRGTCEFSVSDETLALGVRELIVSLGIKTTMRVGPSVLNGVRHKDRYRMVFRTDLPVFRLSRKLERLPKVLPTPRAKYRYIKEVNPVESRPVKCIQVDSPDSTYLCGENMIPTHNTTLARQVAILAGAGIHPFNYTEIPPVRTLFVDLENPEKIIRRQSRRIIEAINANYPRRPITAALYTKPDGLNILTDRDKALLEEQIQRVQPELLVIGPIYKSFIDPGGKTSTALVTEVVMYFDYLRATYNIALWMEHHAPLGNALTGRDLRPSDSAVWMRWPEFGFAIAPDPTSMVREYDFKQWRGPRDVRQWPAKMTRGKMFPFEVSEWAAT